MPMALKQDVIRAKERDGSFKPIDLVHLSGQTLGDQALADEVLGIFVSQARIYLDLMKSSEDIIIIKRAAHSLNGAARGIGAFRLSQLAKTIELDNTSDLSQLQDELQRVTDYIAAIK